MTAVEVRNVDTPPAPRQSRLDPTTEMLLKRLAACLFGGFVLAVMYGTQEGSQNDFGISFHEAMTNHLLGVPRIFIFLAIGALIFGLITFWGVVKQYARRPGALPMLIALLVVIVAQVIMNWYDPRADVSGASKFGRIKSLIDKTSAAQQTTTWFFDWLSWALIVGGIVIGGIAIVTRRREIGYLTTICGIAGAVLAWQAHSDIVSLDKHIDHSLGVYADVIGFLVLAAAGAVIARSDAEVADWRAFLMRGMDFRPGLPLAVGGLVLGGLSYGRNCWYAPIGRNLNFSKTGDAYSGTNISSLASQYLDWLGWVSFAVVAALAVAATIMRSRTLGWLAAASALAAVVMTLFSLKSMTEVAAKQAPQFGTTWNNLGAGGFTACISFGLFGAAAVYVVARRRPRAARNGRSPLPVSQALEKARNSANVKALIVAALAIALFYPPTLSLHWQTVLVNEMSVYLLLGVGLNVVVGWAGLLDLGYIAFYAVGAYTTAYLTGALPKKPPSWLHMTPLLTIPFAIVACLIAGVLLGAPTLRLRGDYLAIVTLGFGEIIQEIAINNPGNLTNGPQGIKSPVPHPILHLGSLKLTWGQDNLPYWYLLLVILVIVIVLFYRVENSRIGRAWAAIREDEVAAQASGINTVRAKLLAFAIGASTSGVAGSFYASQTGFFDPSLFTVFASILIVAYVVFGGMGSLAGALAGAAVLTWLPEFLKSQVPTDDRQMWVGALVLAMMIFRPAGLLPAKRRKAELGHLDEASAGEVSAIPRSGAM